MCFSLLYDSFILCLQISCCDYHSAAVTESGCVFTFGSKECGKLGHGRDNPSGSLGRVNEIAKFYDVDNRTLIPNVKIGYVSVYIDSMYRCMV